MMQRTVLIRENPDGKWLVHLRGDVGNEFGTLPEAEAWADGLQMKHGGPAHCRIVTLDRHGRNVDRKRREAKR